MFSQRYDTQIRLMFARLLCFRCLHILKSRYHTLQVSSTRSGSTAKANTGMRGYSYLIDCALCKCNRVKILSLQPHGTPNSPFFGKMIQSSVLAPIPRIKRVPTLIDTLIDIDRGHHLKLGGSDIFCCPHRQKKTLRQTTNGIDWCWC